MNILQFMGEHPILTFFLAGFASQTIIGVFKAIFCKCDKKVKPMMVS